MTVSPQHALDHELVKKMVAFAVRRFPEEIDLSAKFPGLQGEPAALQFLAPWTAYGHPVRERRVVDWFLESRSWSLIDTEREWLEAQRESWYSIHEVLAVNPGRGLRLRDLFTLRERFVQEVKATLVLTPHLLLLCRVVESGGTAVMAGLYPQPLAPIEGMRVVDAVRARLGKKGVVSPELLRGSTLVVEAWDDAVLRLRSREAPHLTNTDGEEILIAAERYWFDPARRSEVEAALHEAKLVHSDGGTFIHLRKKDRTVLGTVIVGDGELRVEANSAARSDALCLIVEEACGEILSAGFGSRANPLARTEPEPEPEPETSPEAAEILLAYKRNYYHRDWMTQRIPALDGKTPRQAARSKRGRQQLETLLKQLEYGESLLPRNQRFDVNELRKLLGM